MNGHTMHQMIIHETMPKWKCIKARVCHGYYYYLLEVMLHFRVLHMIMYAIWCITSISITTQWDVLIWFKISSIIVSKFMVLRIHIMILELKSFTIWLFQLNQTISWINTISSLIWILDSLKTLCHNNVKIDFQ